MIRLGNFHSPPRNFGQYRAVLLTMVAAWLLSACVSDPEKPTWQTYKPIFPKYSYETSLVWQTSFGKFNRFDVRRFQMQSDRKGNYYLISALGGVQSIDGRDAIGVYGGRNPRYFVQTEHTFISGPTLHNNTLLAGTAEGYFVAMDATTGKEMWKLNLESEVVSLPTIVKNTAFLRTQNGVLFAIDAVHGKILWRKYHNMPTLFIRGFSRVSKYQNTLIVGWADGKVEAIDIATSESKWVTQIAIARGRTDLERVVDIHGKIVLHKGLAYAQLAFGNEAKLVALDASTGKEVWTQPYEGTADMAIVQDSLIVFTGKGEIYALSTRTGAVIWKNTDLEGLDITATIVQSDFIIAADSNGWLHWFDGLNGDRVYSRAHVQEFEGEGRLIGQMSLLSDGSLLVIDGQADISRYSPLALRNH